jgi:hypothetical protein
LRGSQFNDIPCGQRRPHQIKEYVASKIRQIKEYVASKIRHIIVRKSYSCLTLGGVHLRSQ